MNKKIKKRALLSTAFLGVLVVMPFLFGCSAQAINGSYNEPSIQKALLTDMVRCYENGSIKTSIKLSDFSNFSMLLNGNSIEMGLPNGLTDVKNNQIGCAQLFLSNTVEIAGLSSIEDFYRFFASFNSLSAASLRASDAIASMLSPGEFDGLFLLSGKGEYMDNIVDPEERAAFLQKLGYMPAESLGDCVYYVYGEKYTGNICYDNGGLKIDNNPAGKRVYSDGKGDNSGLGITFSTDPDGSGTVGQELYVCRNGSCEYVGSAALGWETLKTKTEETLIKNHLTISGYKYEKAVSNTHGNATYILPEISSYPTTRTIGRPIQFFSTNGYTSYASLAYNSNEQLTYLTNGLVNWIFKGIDMDNYLKCDIENPALEPTFTIIGLDLKSGKANPKCGIDKSFAINDSLYGFDSDNYFDPSVILSLDDIIQMIKDLLESGATADIITDGSNSKNACLTSGGAGNLGYIICNVLDMVGNATTDIYNSAVKPALEVQPSLFSGEGSGTYQAWGVFQNIANTAFIIMVLFVIFSQVTGVGIDNYGIKKIMPKLIIAAILINLSYIICQLCVDLSNIVGNSIQDLFESIARNLTFSEDLQKEFAGINWGTEIGVTLLFSLAVGGAIAMAWTNPAMVLALLVGALGVLISILFVFALLGARQAALVVLTVISPLAFACYMLPNTKKLFDKWVKLGEGLLLVYPICGLLIGGGDFVGRLLLSSGVAGESFWTALIAMLAGIMPIFFIPTVLKSSFAAFGKVGATLSGLGDRARSGATSKIKGSDSYKGLQQVSQRRKVRIKAGRDKDGNLTDIGRAKNWIASHGIGKSLYGKTYADYNKKAEKYRQEDIEAAASASNDAVRAELAEHPNKTPLQIYDTKLHKAIQNKASSNELFSIIDAAKSAGIKEKDIAEMTRGAFDNNSLGYMGNEQSNFIREFGGRYAGSFLKKDFQQKAWSLGGGMDENGQRTNLSNQKVKVGDMTDEEVGEQSKKSYERLQNMGAIGSAQAGRVYDANKGEDDVMRYMLYQSSKGTPVSAGQAEAAVANQTDETKKILQRSATRVVVDGGNSAGQTSSILAGGEADFKAAREQNRRNGGDWAGNRPR